MGTTKEEIENFHLVESNYDDIKAFEKTNWLSFLLIFIFFFVLPFSLMYYALDIKAQTSFGFLGYLIGIIVIFIFIQPRIKKFITQKRLKASLNFYREIEISFDSELDGFTYKPKDPSFSIDNLLKFMIVFLVDIIIVIIVREIYTNLIPESDTLLVILYMIGVLILLFGYLTLIYLLGFCYWDRSTDYYAESFYLLKAIIMNNKKTDWFEFICASFGSYAELLALNDIIIDFDENRIRNDGNIVDFFSPKNEIVSVNLNELTTLLRNFQEKNWLEALKAIESFENKLENQKEAFKSKYLSKEYEEVETWGRKSIQKLKEIFFDDVIGKLILLLIIWFIYVVFGINI